MYGNPAIPYTINDHECKPDIKQLAFGAKFAKTP